MKKITDTTLLSTYIHSCKLQAYLDQELIPISSLYSFEKGEHLICLDIPSDYLYFLVKGTVRVYTYSSDTQNVVINQNEAVSMLGEASSLWGLSPKSNVIAETACICVGINLKKHRELLQHDVRFLQNVCQILSYRLNSGITLANTLTEPVEIRLAKFILDNAQENRFSVKLTTCAAILNVSYRHLLRTINHFKESDILAKESNYLVILDKEKLIDMTNHFST